MSNSARKVTAIVIGAGNRGNVYAQYALEEPARFQIVGVAEPRPYARAAMKDAHRVPDAHTFATWEEAAAADKMADAVIITTQDRMHVEPACAFAAKGYHILLEKPMAVEAAACKRIVAAVEAAGVMLAIGHVLRYTPYMQQLVRMLRGGAIGEIVNIVHVEPIGHEHFAHSFVRGNWHSAAASGPLLLTKCCHDVDLLSYMCNKPVLRVSSFGGLLHFKPENKPAGAAERCLDCPVEAACAYSAKRIYLDRARKGEFGWPVAPILDVGAWAATPLASTNLHPHCLHSAEPSVAAVEAALRTGPYGVCAYAGRNDVCDNQVVALQFEGGATATLTTVAYTKKICQRSTRIYGTGGEIEGDGERTLVHTDFVSGATTTHVIPDVAPGSKLLGHGGADFCLISAFVEAVASGDASRILSGPADSLNSHLLVFAAELARRSGGVVDLSGGIEALRRRTDLDW